VLLPVHQVTVAAISHFSRAVDELSQTSLYHKLAAKKRRFHI
jgi:hypothetical protein